MLSLFTGLVAGLLHVVTGPDHLAAVAPLAADQRRGAWLAGLRWGLGHAGGVVAVGLLSLLLRGTLPLAAVSSWSERLVGVVLIGIGLWGLRRALGRHVHAHEHTHDGRAHRHFHVHGGASAHTHAESRPHQHTHAAFAVGLLHGLAGSSHLLGVLPALAFATTAETVTYLAAFGAGTVLAMVAFSWLVGRVTHDRPWGTLAYRRWLGACSVAAVAVGGWWLVAAH